MGKNDTKTPCIKCGKLPEVPIFPARGGPPWLTKSGECRSCLSSWISLRNWRTKPAVMYNALHQKAHPKARPALKTWNELPRHMKERAYAMSGAALRERKFSAETRAKIGAALRGRKRLTDAQRTKLRDLLVQGLRLLDEVGRPNQRAIGRPNKRGVIVAAPRRGNDRFKVGDQVTFTGGGHSRRLRTGDRLTVKAIYLDNRYPGKKYVTVRRNSDAFYTDLEISRLKAAGGSARLTKHESLRANRSPAVHAGRG